jgi:hypothetical protein
MKEVNFILKNVEEYVRLYLDRDSNPEVINKRLAFQLFRTRLIGYERWDSE